MSTPPGQQIKPHVRRLDRGQGTEWACTGIGLVGWGDTPIKALRAWSASVRAGRAILPPGYMLTMTDGRVYLTPRSTRTPIVRLLSGEYRIGERPRA